MVPISSRICSRVESRSEEPSEGMSHLFGNELHILMRCDASQAQADRLKQFFDSDRAEFAVVPDLVVEGAFNKSLEGVEYVIHTASPLPHEVRDDTGSSSIKGH